MPSFESPPKEATLMESKVKILGIVGSLRKASFNKSLMVAAVELVPDNADIEVFDIANVPPFNQDFETDPPQIVKDFKARIRAADALLIATPEYNYSIPGVLKNAIDWASRPKADKSLRRQTRRVNERVCGQVWRSARPIPPAAILRFPQYAPPKLS